MTEWIYEMFPLLYPLCQRLWLYTGLWQTVYMDYRMGIFGDKSGFIKTDYEPTKSSLDQPIVTGLTRYIVNHSRIRLVDERIYYWTKIRIYWSHSVKNRYLNHCLLQNSWILHISGLFWSKINGLIRLIQNSRVT